MKAKLFFLFLLIPFINSYAQPKGDPKLTEIWSPVPKVIIPGKTVTIDAP
jgi:hypothetical protein